MGLNVRYDERVIRKCRYGTKGSVGFDIATVEPVIVPPGCYKKVSTGVYLDLPNGWYGLLTHRSGLCAKKGGWIHGIIDTDYKGELIATLFNHDPSKELRLEAGEYFAQLVPTPSYFQEFVNVPVEDKERGEGRHGSTGS